MRTLEFELLRTDLEDAIKILKFRNNREDAEIANDIQKAIEAIQYIDNKEIIKEDLIQSTRNHWWNRMYLVGLVDQPCPYCGQPIPESKSECKDVNVESK